MCCKVGAKEEVHVIYNIQTFEISGKRTWFLFVKQRIGLKVEKRRQVFNFYTTVKYMATDSSSLAKYRVAFHDTVSLNQIGPLGSVPACLSNQCIAGPNIGEIQPFKKNDMQYN